MDRPITAASDDGVGRVYAADTLPSCGERAKLLKLNLICIISCTTYKKRTKMWTIDLKIAIFRAYCTPMYGSQLWYSMYQYSFNKLRIAYNDAFRHLLQEPRWCSASKLFVLNSVSSIPANMRKLTFSLWRSLQTSDNSLVNAVLSSDLFFLNHQSLKVGVVVCFSLV